MLGFERVVLALLLGLGALHAKAPRFGLRDRASVVGLEIDRRDLLEHPVGEAAREFDQVLERHLRRYRIAQLRRRVKAPVRAAEHGMDAGQAAAITDREAAERIQHRRRRDETLVRRRLRIRLVEVERVAVARGPGPVAHRIAGDLGEKRRVLDLDALADEHAHPRQFRVRDASCMHALLAVRILVHGFAHRGSRRSRLASGCARSGNPTTPPSARRSIASSSYPKRARMLLVCSPRSGEGR